jgi:hypothetical protein
MGERIIHDLVLLREALGILGDHIVNQFAKDRPKPWEEEWDFEDDKEWVSRETEELLAEKVEFHEYLKG